MQHKAPDWKHGLEHAALSDVGLRRPNNQDALAVVLADDQEGWRRKGHVFVVADGMGAHAAGQLASQMAVQTVPAAYRERLDRPPAEAIREAVRAANARICTQAQANHELRGMGTTVSALVLLPYGALVAHVGDSRVYRLRGNRLEQWTFDHSLVWEVCAAEGISPAEAPKYMPRNIITRSVGPSPEVEVDLEGLIPLQLGDTFLLSSDGLSGLVEDHELGAVLRCLPPDEAVYALVDLAIFRGGRDNVTAVVVRVAGPEALDVPDDDCPAAGVRTDRADAVSGGPDPMTRVTTNAGRLGKGPYVTVDCTPDAPFVFELAEIVDDLHGGAAGQRWDVDWARFGALSQQAAAAALASDYPEAVRQYARAVSLVLSRLKARRDEEGVQP
jgi:serine/threonine protein phosphatase PrpC